MKTLTDFTGKEQEFRKFTHDWIAVKDKRFQETEALAQSNKPLRHPKGETHRMTDRKYLWSDLLWCQDRHTEPFELFFYTEDEDPEDDEFFNEMLESQGTDSEAGKVWDWLTNIFNEEFVKVCPDIKHVLEG